MNGDTNLLFGILFDRKLHGNEKLGLRGGYIPHTSLDPPVMQNTTWAFKHTSCGIKIVVIVLLHYKEAVKVHETRTLGAAFK